MISDVSVDIYYTFFKKKDKNGAQKKSTEQKVESDVEQQETDRKRTYTFGEITDDNRSNYSLDDKHHVKILKSGSLSKQTDNTKKVHVGTKNDSSEKKYSEEHIIPLFNSDILNGYPQDAQGQNPIFEEFTSYVIRSQKHYEETPKNCH